MVSERYMRPSVDKLIEQRYGKPMAILEEVPILYGRADIVYLYDGEPYVIAVELKIRDWRRGLRQALRNTLIAKYSFLAIQYKRPRNINTQLFMKFGVGLIAVDGLAKVVVEPRESEYFSRYKQYIVKRLWGLLNHDVANTRKCSISRAQATERSQHPLRRTCHRP